MTKHSRTADELPQALWTGRLEFDLFDAGERRLGIIELVVRIDHVTVWWGNETLAVIHRDPFRRWLRRRQGDFGCDDTIWLKHGANVALRVHAGQPHPVPPDVVATLRDVI